MELTHEDVLAILDLLNRSSVEYLEVELGGTRIVADKTGCSSAATVTRSPARPAAEPAARPAAAPPAGPPATPPAAAPASAGGPVAAGPGLLSVPAPMVGVFYRSPEPGAPPFVEVGSRVEQGATLGLVEVMKMFNGVSAPAAGEVVQVLVDDDEFVEFGQPLMVLLLEPAA